jgi:hypothetical protein
MNFREYSKDCQEKQEKNLEIKKKVKIQVLNKLLTPIKVSKFDKNFEIDKHGSGIFTPDSKVSEKFFKLSKKLEKNCYCLNFCDKVTPFFKETEKVANSDGDWVYLKSSVIKKISAENRNSIDFALKFNDSSLIRKFDF